MALRKRVRRTIGRTSTPCPLCSGGPLVLTESRDVLRPWQRLRPGCDAHVAYREVCTACGMRFDVEPNTTEPQPADAPASAEQAGRGVHS